MLIDRLAMAGLKRDARQSSPSNVGSGTTSRWTGSPSANQIITLIDTESAAAKHKQINKQDTRSDETQQHKKTGLGRLMARARSSLKRGLARLRGRNKSKKETGWSNTKNVIIVQDYDLEVSQPEELEQEQAGDQSWSRPSGSREPFTSHRSRLSDATLVPLCFTLDTAPATPSATSAIRKKPNRLSDATLVSELGVLTIKPQEAIFIDPDTSALQLEGELESGPQVCPSLQVYPTNMPKPHFFSNPARFTSSYTRTHSLRSKGSRTRSLRSKGSSTGSTRSRLSRGSTRSKVSVFKFPKTQSEPPQMQAQDQQVVMPTFLAWAKEWLKRQEEIKGQDQQNKSEGSSAASSIEEYGISRSGLVTAA